MSWFACVSRRPVQAPWRTHRRYRPFLMKHLIVCGVRPSRLRDLAFLGASRVELDHVVRHSLATRPPCVLYVTRQFLTGGACTLVALIWVAFGAGPVAVFLRRRPRRLRHDLLCLCNGHFVCLVFASRTMDQQPMRRRTPTNRTTMIATAVRLRVLFLSDESPSSHIPCAEPVRVMFSSGVLEPRRHMTRTHGLAPTINVFMVCT